MKKCIKCGKLVMNNNHDLCHRCWAKQEMHDGRMSHEEHFESNLDNNETHTVYIMFYGGKENKIGYTCDLNSRRIEIKRKYPQNELVYFREFMTESEARRFEAWLKRLKERELIKFISNFQDKIRKIKFL